MGHASSPQGMEWRTVLPSQSSKNVLTRKRASTESPSLIGHLFQSIACGRNLPLLLVSPQFCFGSEAEISHLRSRSSAVERKAAINQVPFSEPSISAMGQSESSLTPRRFNSQIRHRQSPGIRPRAPDFECLFDYRPANIRRRSNNSST